MDFGVLLSVIHILNIWVNNNHSFQSITLTLFSLLNSNYSKQERNGLSAIDNTPTLHIPFYFVSIVVNGDYSMVEEGLTTLLKFMSCVLWHLVKLFCQGESCRTSSSSVDVYFMWRQDYYSLYNFQKNTTSFHSYWVI